MYYKNSGPGALFSAVEFLPLPQGNETFFYSSPQNADALKDFVTRVLGQTVDAKAQLNGETVLITSGKQSQPQLKQILEQNKAILNEVVVEKQIDPWKWRGGLNMAGQSLQLTSGYLRQSGLDAPKLTFAGTNILASLINVTFGEQHSEDAHQLRFLKDKFNRDLSQQVSDPALLPSPDDNRQHLRTDAGTDLPLNRLTSFMRHHSVRLGEMSLRLFASIALTFPVKQWKPAMKAFEAEGIGAALRVGRNPNSLNFYAGSVYLVGKTVGLFSKVPDPYNPAPQTWLDRLREKVFFRLSGYTETVAASMLAYDGFKNGEITLAGKKRRDTIGGVGGLLLAASLMTRTTAKFGIRDVDMPELYAHVTDALTLVPPEKLPEAIATITARIKEHFGQNVPSYGNIHKQLTEELYRYHPNTLQLQIANNVDEPDLPRENHEVRSIARNKEISRTSHIEQAYRRDSLLARG